MLRNAIKFMVCLWLGLSSEAAITFTRGPFVQNAGTNSMSFVWITSSDTDSAVYYRESGGSGDFLGVSNTIPMTHHIVTVTNLTADTRYEYYVESGNGIETQASVPAWFRTLKPSGPISFQVVGDTPAKAPGTANPDTINVANAMGNENTDLVLHLGDLNYFGYLDIEFFNVFQPQMKSVPFFLVTGNHDASESTASAFLDMFYLPTNSATGDERFYSFDHGDVHFVGLFNPWFQLWDFTKDTAQLQWLTNDLAHTTKKWKIIFMHFPVATSATHVLDDYNYNAIPDHVEMMQLLGPIAQQYGVQMIFGSHDHDYERFAPTNGFHSIVAGGGGRGLYTMLSQHPASVQFYRTYQFLRVSVTNETMLVESVNTNGVTFDSVSITLEPPTPQTWLAQWNSPVLESAPANDGDGNINGQSFDFAGAPIPAVTGRFSNLGRVYVNNDSTNLYIGFQEAAFYRGNNVFLFIESPRRSGVATMAGLGNGFADPSDQGADGLDCLENLSFSNFNPSVACLLGDEYADGKFRSFSRANLGLNIGQGIFYLDSSFTYVPGTRLQQYNRSPQTNESPMTETGVNTEQNADYIELAIPYSALGEIVPGDIIKVGAVVGGTGYDANAQTRELDTGFFGTSFAGSGSVILEGLSVRLAGNPANPDWDGDGLPNTWELACGLDPYSATDENGGTGDPDHDGMNNAQEYFAGTIPRDPDSCLRAGLQVSGPTQLRLSWSAVVGKRYQIQRSEGALTNFVDLVSPDLPRTATSAHESYPIAWPTPASPPAYYRVRVLP